MKTPIFVVATAVFCTNLSYPAPQAVQGLVNLRFQPDVRVFAVMAALNAAGFDSAPEVLAQNPLRRAVKERMSSVSGELLYKLRDFYEGAGDEGGVEKRQARFISYALLMNGPPDFSVPFKPEEIPEDARPAAGFEKLVAQLWREARLAELWKQVAPQYVDEIEAYRPLIRDMIIGAVRYMHTEARIALDRQVTFIPDLLNAFGVVNGRNIGNTYVVVVGPSRSRDRSLKAVRHEYFHFLLDPLLASQRREFPPPEPFLARVRLQPSAPAAYRGDFPLVVTESLIRAVELRLDAQPREAALSRMLELYDQGLILVPRFAEELEKFERTTEPMQQYFPALIAGIRDEAPEARAASMDRLRTELAGRGGGQPARAQDSAPNEVAGLLAEANRLLVARQFDQAAVVLERVLGADEHNANALFGLGQVALHRQEFETALDLYSRAAANATAGETWIAAWSYVHRGNVYKFLDQPEKARAEWTRVLELKGDMRGATEAAQKALEGH